MPTPTSNERFFFDNNGYLLLERFLDPTHVNRLLDALTRTVTQRRQLAEVQTPHTGITKMIGTRSTRIFYILDDDPAFLELLDWPPMMPYITTLLNDKPHHHASDAIVEYGDDLVDRKLEWHRDGQQESYRGLGQPIPLLQLKIGYYLNDMAESGQGNLTIIPGSHKTKSEPDPKHLRNQHALAGAKSICAPAGSAILFHNALWHTSGSFTRTGGQRLMLYYAYEHPWMMASQEHWGYPKRFYNHRLSSQQRAFFHGFLFDPPEQRWG